MSFMDSVLNFYLENCESNRETATSNGEETTSESTDVKIEEVFLHSESESILNLPLQSRDALSILF